jgi:hypothetical protein
MFGTVDVAAVMFVICMTVAYVSVLVGAFLGWWKK